MAVTCLPQSDIVNVTDVSLVGAIWIWTKCEDPSEAIQTVVGTVLTSSEVRREPASVAMSSADEFPVILVVATPSACWLPATDAS